MPEGCCADDGLPKTQSDRIGAVFGRCALQFLCIVGGPTGILSASKMILAESDLILRTGIFF